MSFVNLFSPYVCFKCTLCILIICIWTVWLTRHACSPNIRIEIVSKVKTRTNEKADELNQFEDDVLRKDGKLAHYMDKLFSLMFEEPDFSKKYLVYQYDQSLNNIGDFFPGAITGFLISILSQRSFAIKETSGCSHLSWFEPRLISWDVKEEDLRGLTSSRHDVRMMTNFRQQLENYNFDEKFIQDVIYFVVEEEFIAEIRRHFRTFDTMPWILNMAHSDIIRIALYGLFQPSEVLVKKVNEIFQPYNEFNHLVCLHAQINVAKMYSYSYFDPVWNFLKNYGKRANITYNIYIEINSEQIKKKAKEEFGSTIVDFDNYFYLFSDDGNKCNEYFRNVLQMTILQNCNALIITDSLQGKYAAYMRASSDNLYCYVGTSSVFECNRDVLKSTLSWD
ncbi:hypothetical protein CHS0354_038497 [Potamilus streckersoni]|uniref:Fucosyltransferase n=1 Tax=Potamilus streckersoni TaxID=2493646 RepID=A0AAE0S6T6_9BIVA|nr:hypothetical protein CHS0354_038497 [Potamilus streckersoni]